MKYGGLLRRDFVATLLKLLIAWQLRGLEIDKPVSRGLEIDKPVSRGLEIIPKQI